MNSGWVFEDNDIYVDIHGIDHGITLLEAEPQAPDYRRNLSDAEKESIIAGALETDEGRIALAQAMVEPIRRSLDYQGVGRRLLMVDELPQGALPRYERDVASIAHIVARQGINPDQIIEGEEILVPTFEVASNPTVRLSDIRARRFNIVDRVTENAIRDIQNEEDRNIFAALYAAQANLDEPDSTFTARVEEKVIIVEEVFWVEPEWDLIVDSEI